MKQRPDTEHGLQTTRPVFISGPSSVHWCKYGHERESLMDVVHEQCGENKWNVRCVEEDSVIRYLVGLDEECNMTIVDAMKGFLVHAWNERQ
ncbi:hypothetical protein FHG87_011412 [Trinorchestia longiramus]|nr:hypothetical protein FHG87_011412 [Trinorchestia longiramus]